MSNTLVVNGFPANSYKLDQAFTKKRTPKHEVWAYWFPILSSAFAIGSFVAGYVMAVLNDDEGAWFSFISDGGALSPESCVFGILLNYAAFFWILTGISRHIHLSQFMQFHNLHGFGWLFARWTLLVLALLSGIGISIVANFQEFNVPEAHRLGAWLAFFLGLAYIWVYIIISVLIRPKFAPNSLTLFRAILAVLTTVALVLHITAVGSTAFVKEDADGNKPPKPSHTPNIPLRLDPDSPYYANHLVATVSEWILAILSQVFALTLSYEMDTLTVTALSTEELDETTDEPELKNIKQLD